MLLQLRQVRKSYGDTTVIRGLDLAVQEGEFVGIIGPNGAGKTTAFGLISGGLSCDAGQVLLDGKNVTALGADARCRAGIARTFQIPQPFQAMTVFENALVGASFGGNLHGLRASDAAKAALDACGLSAVADRMAGELSLLQRKRLELARAVSTQPRLLLLDEVGGGLTDPEMHQLLELVRSLHRGGITVLWIEHLVHALVSVAQRLVVLAEGTLLADGVPAEVIGSALVRQTYLGDELAMETDFADAGEAC